MDLTMAEELRAGATLALQLVAVVAVGTFAGRRCSPADRLVAWLIGALVAIATAVAIPLGLAMVGLASWGPVLAVHLVALGAAAAALLGERRAAREGALRPTGRPGPYVAVAAAAVTICVSLAILAALGPPSGDTDTREYHITNMASWFRPGDLWTLPYQSPAGVTATHPGNSDVLALWLSLPSHGDELAYAMPVPFALLALLGSALLARELADGQRPPDEVAALGALAGAVVLTVPLFVSTQFGSLTNDLAVAACVVTAMGLLAFARRAPSIPVVLAAGLALGLGVGAKYTALVPMALITIGALWLVPRRRWWWLVPGVALMAVPWYLRNLLETGNPVFPQALGPLAGGASPLQVIDTPMLDHVVHLDRDVLREAAPHAARRLGPVLGLAGLGTVLLLRAAVTSRLARVVVVVAVGAFVGYLATPFSGGGPTGLLFLIVSSFRYSMVFVLLATVALATLIRARPAVVALVAVLGWNLFRLVDEVQEHRPDITLGTTRLIAVVILGLGAAAVVSRADILATAAHRHRTPMLAGASALVAFAILAGAGAAAFHRYDRGHDLRPLEHALLAVGPDEPVIVLGVFDLRSLLGPRLERPLVGVSRDGEVGEVPFVDENQIRRLFLDDTTAPASASAFVPALDRAVAEAGAELLVVGSLGEFSYPEGWAPDERWCPVERVGAITIYATGELRASETCETETS